MALATGLGRENVPRRHRWLAPNAIYFGTKSSERFGASRRFLRGKRTLQAPMASAIPLKVRGIVWQSAGNTADCEYCYRIPARRLSRSDPRIRCAECEVGRKGERQMRICQTVVAWGHCSLGP